MTEEQIDTYFKRSREMIGEVGEMIGEANKKKYDIEHRSWKGMKPRYKDEKIRKRI